MKREPRKSCHEVYRGAMTILLLSTFRPLLGRWCPSPYSAACSARLASYLEVSRSAVRKMAYGPSWYLTRFGCWMILIPCFKSSTVSVSLSLTERTGSPPGVILRNILYIRRVEGGLDGYQSSLYQCCQQLDCMYMYMAIYIWTNYCRFNASGFSESSSHDSCRN